MREIRAVDILISDKWVAFLLQITKSMTVLISTSSILLFKVYSKKNIDGKIRIYRKEDTQSFALLAEAEDPEPLKSEYISFGSWNKNLVKFYFNCSFSLGQPDEVFDTTEHPLLSRDVPKAITLRNCT